MMPATRVKKSSGSLGPIVRRVVEGAQVVDVHTHLYDPAFGPLLLWGLDDLLTYHYLIAEQFRYWEGPFEAFWTLPKEAQAEVVWRELFQRHSPISEACRGVLTTLHALGLDPRRRDLKALRKWFARWTPADYVDHCLQLAGVRRVVMTNSPFDPEERNCWSSGVRRDSRFDAALRIDPLILDWPSAGRQLSEDGYTVGNKLGRKTLSEVRRFLRDWTKRLGARYVMVSMPPDFVYPDRGDGATLLREAVLPHCHEFGLPFALMPGVRRSVNPALRLAGDGMALTRMETLEGLCGGHPENRFLTTVLARENQHALCVLARKFRNLHVFGCWWFTNVPSIIEEMTRMRVELIGLSFTAQHSDARVLDQLIYKWKHSRKILAEVLTEKYDALAASGWTATAAEVERDVDQLLGGEFNRFCSGAAPAPTGLSAG
jgi:hypothetical protein